MKILKAIKKMMQRKGDKILPQPTPDRVEYPHLTEEYCMEKYGKSRSEVIDDIEFISHPDAVISIKVVRVSEGMGKLNNQ